MLIRFLSDYRGRLTDERFYVAGQAVEFPAGVAAELIRRRRAVQVVEADSPPTFGDDTGADEIGLDHLTYRELQALAKKHNIAANQSRDDLIEALDDILHGQPSKSIP